MAETAPEATEPALSQESVRQTARETLAPLVEQLSTATTTEEQPDDAEQLRETVREAIDLLQLLEHLEHEGRGPAAEQLASALARRLSAHRNRTRPDRGPGPRVNRLRSARPTS
ncbi:hypothetical protein [Streptomyces sp. NPDC055607]